MKRLKRILCFMGYHKFEEWRSLCQSKGREPKILVRRGCARKECNYLEEWYE